MVGSPWPACHRHGCARNALLMHIESHIARTTLEHSPLLDRVQCRGRSPTPGARPHHRPIGDRPRQVALTRMGAPQSAQPPVRRHAFPRCADRQAGHHRRRAAGVAPRVALPEGPAQSNSPVRGGARHGGRRVALRAAPFASRRARISSITSRSSVQAMIRTAPPYSSTISLSWVPLVEHGTKYEKQVTFPQRVAGCRPLHGRKTTLSRGCNARGCVRDDEYYPHHPA
jgi:hypothetical protein